MGKAECCGLPIVQRACSSACVCAIVWEYCKIKKIKWMLEEKQLQVEEESLWESTLHSTRDCATWKWSKATNLLIAGRIHFHRSPVPCYPSVCSSSAQSCLCPPGTSPHCWRSTGTASWCCAARLSLCPKPRAAQQGSNAGMLWEGHLRHMPGSQDLSCMWWASLACWDAVGHRGMEAQRAAGVCGAAVQIAALLQGGQIRCWLPAPSCWPVSNPLKQERLEKNVILRFFSFKK